jgi:hypothetical protein
MRIEPALDKPQGEHGDDEGDDEPGGGTCCLSGIVARVA